VKTIKPVEERIYHKRSIRKEVKAIDLKTNLKHSGAGKE
jgi:hypothetical protein